MQTNSNSAKQESTLKKDHEADIRTGTPKIRHRR